MKFGISESTNRVKVCVSWQVAFRLEGFLDPCYLSLLFILLSFLRCHWSGYQLPCPGPWCRRCIPPTSNSKSDTDRKHGWRPRSHWQKRWILRRPEIFANIEDPQGQNVERTFSHESEKWSINDMFDGQNPASVGFGLDENTRFNGICAISTGFLPDGTSINRTTLRSLAVTIPQGGHKPGP